MQNSITKLAVLEDRIALDGEERRDTEDESEEDDEEVFALPESESEPEEGEDEGWGDSRKQYYSADAAVAPKEEEAEALRLQKQRAAKLSESDYGIDREMPVEDDNDAPVKKPMTEKDKLRFLRRTSPELFALLKEYKSLKYHIESILQPCMQTYEVVKEKLPPTLAALLESKNGISQTCREH